MIAEAGSSPNLRDGLILIELTLPLRGIPPGEQLALTSCRAPDSDYDFSCCTKNETGIVPGADESNSSPESTIKHGSRSRLPPSVVVRPARMAVG